MSSMLIVAGEVEYPGSSHEWGTGGWLMPEDREALDWATLARLSGWEVDVQTDYVGQHHRWLVIACDPDSLGERAVDSIAARLHREPLLVISRAPSFGAALAKLAAAVRGDRSAEGQTLQWAGRGAPERWRLRTPIEAADLRLASGSLTWATLDRKPAIAVRAYGRGLVATLSLHPSAARDSDGAGTELLRRLLVAGTPAPVAWLDLEGTVVLRMDDPGSPEPAYHRAWGHSRLGVPGLAEVGEQLARRRARMSLAYVMGWVDDGDATRGRLEVNGRQPPRLTGAIHPSPAVRYEDLSGIAPGRVHDLATQFDAIQALRQRGLADVELHGFTHMHPERERWARDERRSEVLEWYRELHAMHPGNDPLRPAIESFRVHWGARPTTLIPPGDAWNGETMRRAIDHGLELVCSYYLAIRNGKQWWWSQHVCSPYLDRAAEWSFASGLPVVGYFHEYDLAVYGTRWLAERLDEWEDAGAARFIDFRQLATALACRPAVEVEDGEPLVGLGRPRGARSPWPVRVKVQLRGNVRPIAVTIDPARPASNMRAELGRPAVGSATAQ
jgi:hypothetical protein